VWLIIRIIIGKSCGVEDTREIPKESKKNLGIPGKEANGNVLKNGELHVSAANHAMQRNYSKEGNKRRLENGAQKDGKEQFRRRQPHTKPANS